MIKYLLFELLIKVTLVLWRKMQISIQESVRELLRWWFVLRIDSL